jgi:predicted DNA-binding ArsR family transcriptional regulator
MKKEFLMTEEEMKRHKVLSEVLEGMITLKEASEFMGVSYRQAIRLKKRFLRGGMR